MSGSGLEMASDREALHGPRGAAAHDDVLRPAMLALQDGRANDAERIARDVLARSPDDARALHVFGCALLMQGRVEEAIAPLEQAARKRHDPEIDTQVAIALRRAGRFDEALARLKRATRRRPPYAAAFHELGYLLSCMQRYDDALAALERGVELAPMMPEMSIQLGYVCLALHDHARAHTAFARALAIGPNYPDANYGMGMVLLDGGEFGAAAGHFRRCLASQPDKANAWLNLGYCLLELGERDAGHDCFRRAARAGPHLRGMALSAIVSSAHGRFWVRPSEALRFMRGETN
jgi:tetratricopeptide (TPR) repeat protein